MHQRFQPPACDTHAVLARLDRSGFDRRVLSQNLLDSTEPFSFERNYQIPAKAQPMNPPTPHLETPRELSDLPRRFALLRRGEESFEATERTAPQQQMTVARRSGESGGPIGRFGAEALRRPAPPSRVLHVSLAYNSIRAGQRAVRLLDDLSDEAGNPLKFHPVVWRFEHLEDPHWHDVATSDAVSADLLMIATDDASAVSWSIKDWVRASLDRRAEARSAAVVVLHETVARRPVSHYPQLEAIQSLTEASGANFFAPTPQEKEHRLLSPVYRTESASFGEPGIRLQSSAERASVAFASARP